ncbi:hypothetical protein A11A3_00510 [Alcanivorax hongdengensis A-11-3]|uniref:Alkaline phosphatase n=1 Tax=Alcanivorax hongdengensis A-11-3 TaxID=1177179 RepID=L0WJD5_9GAMM|nr:alkaline phosphatase PhoX [Alcanivorax hongdengensis]EKF75930.1 hypothetical protein A11A3_00510 [Alcanivorax hongdengensis A-11-3]
MYRPIPFAKKNLAAKVGTVALGAMLLAACGGDSNNQGKSLEFTPVNAPATDAQKRQILVSPSAKVDGEEHSVGYHTLLRSGDSVDSEVVFGRLVDESGAPLYGSDGELQVTDYNEHTSLLPIGDRLFSVSQMETRPGAMFLMELDQDKDTGVLSTKKLWQIDQSSVHGGWVHCAATVTPWNTHLASEEYEPDAAEEGSADSMAPYFGGDTSKVNPYFWGWNIEIKVNASGDEQPTTELSKHYALGRLAFELAKVMPDQKTVYMSDDGSDVGFYMFVADTAGDLSAGSLYAAKWNQTSGEGLGEADLEWIDLGHATDSEIEAYVDGAGALSFDDMFEQTAATEDTCPDGYAGIKANSSTLQCLKVKPGMEKAASRLEARRYAAVMGATTELRKEEGQAFDPATKTLYVSMSEVQKGMLDGDKYDTDYANHIRLKTRNDCGGVYQLQLGTDTNIGSEYVAKTMKGLIAGIPASYDENSPYATYTCDKDGIANPDNITFIDGYNTLMIGEDSGSGHQNDMVWALDLSKVDANDPKAGLTRVQTTPYGSETTGLYWYPNINGFAYLMSVVQHPYGESDSDQIPDGSLDHRAYTGYVGPFPAMD